LQVMPFHPHKEAAIIDVGVQNAPRQGYQQALDSEGELKRVLATVQHVRSSIYQTLDQVRARHDTSQGTALLQRPPALAP
jgi:dihydropteroate synthase